MEAGAKVINLSLGGPYMASKSAEFYTRFVNEYGVFMTAAAGNDGNTNKVYPAAHPQIVSVSAVTESGVRWPGASYGDQTELSAPGRKILSTYVFDVAVRMDETGFGHMASAVEGAPKGPVTGILRLCDSTDSKCASTGNGDICLYEKEPEDQINDLANKCVAGNGGGMIVFSSNGSPYSTWRTTSSSIPIVAVKTSIGSELTQMNLGEQVTILGDAGGNSPEYSYAYLTGTSMATPHVAAAAALLWTHFPECTNHQIRYALAVTARHPNGEHACDDHIGYGVIQVKDAFDWLYKDPCNSWQVSQTSSGGCTTLHQ